MNSFISWVGGKKALRSLTYTMFPANFDRYIEVFGGGGVVLLGSRRMNGAWRSTMTIIQIWQICFIA